MVFSLLFFTLSFCILHQLSFGPQVFCRGSQASAVNAPSSVGGRRVEKSRNISGGEGGAWPGSSGETLLWLLRVEKRAELAATLCPIHMYNVLPRSHQRTRCLVRGGFASRPWAGPPKASLCPAQGFAEWCDLVSLVSWVVEAALKAVLRVETCLLVIGQRLGAFREEWQLNTWVCTHWDWCVHMVQLAVTSTTRELNFESVW